MGAAKKLEMAPDEVFLQEALKSGRAKLVQNLSMKALGKPDVAFQARDIDTPKGLNMDHVKRLDLIYQLDEKLAPVVVFVATLGKVIKMILADGFHRHEVYRLAKAESIRAYVIEVQMNQIEHEARIFAAMCNQVTLLDRTDADKRKAVEMLLADPVCRGWADGRIGNHCGVSGGTVGKYRSAFNSKNGFALPEHVVDASERTRPYRSGGAKRLNCRTRGNNKGQYYMNEGGKQICLGTNKDGATMKYEEIITTSKRKQKHLNIDWLRTFFAKNNLAFKAAMGKQGGRNPSFPGIRGSQGYGVIWTYARFDLTDTAPWAYGCLHGLRELANQPDTRLVCLCVPEDAPAAVLDLYRKLGIEFLTPDELVESLKGREGEGEGQDEG